MSIARAIGAECVPSCWRCRSDGSMNAGAVHRSRAVGCDEEMFKRLCPALLVGLLLAPLSGCALSGLTHDRLLVWHDWPEAEAAVLTDLLRSYEELDPDLELIVEYVPPGEIESRFAEEVESGFGPDVLIGADAAELSGLVDDGAVHRITPRNSERYGFDDLDSRAMSAMAVDESQRGVPLAAFTDVLYYRDGVAPPGSLGDVIDLAEEGHSVAIPLDFFDAYWGVDAFEGTVFGPGDTIVPDAGFTEWMAWLVEARRHPNVILDGEYEVLRDLFAAGKIDVFVGGSRELGTFRSELQDSGAGSAGSDSDSTTDDDGSAADETVIQESTPTLTNVGEPTFGLTTLPGGDNDEPGGFLDVEGMVVNQHTDSLSGSLALMEYLTNVPSQGRIARAGVGRIPVNPSVAIDSTTSPMEAALVVQQRHAIVLPRRFQDRQSELSEVADDVYLRVTRGLLDPADAPIELRTRYQELMEANDE
jgi:ABC-type glycerol-3-phosphate transport system substrate-binding protein